MRSPGASERNVDFDAGAVRGTVYADPCAVQGTLYADACAARGTLSADAWPDRGSRAADACAMRGGSAARADTNAGTACAESRAGADTSSRSGPRDYPADSVDDPGAHACRASQHDSGAVDGRDAHLQHLDGAGDRSGARHPGPRRRWKAGGRAASPPRAPARV